MTFYNNVCDYFVSEYNMVVFLISFFMATKTTTLAPPSLSQVLKSNTIQSAPVASTSTPTTTSTSNAERLAAIRAANQNKNTSD